MKSSEQSVISKDGTKIGYKSVGQGPGLVLVQGAMGTIDQFTQLAQELSDSFMVYLPERRGRGISPKTYTEVYTTEQDVEDLEALLNETNAKYVFGLSAGAIITLQAARKLTTIEKIAVYEPALFVDGLPEKGLLRFKQDIAEGNTADALVTSMKLAQMGPPIMNYLPNSVLTVMTNKLLKGEVNKPEGEQFWHNVVPTLQFDFKVVGEMSTRWQTFKDIKIEVLLLGGSKSPQYLANALAALETILPQAKRTEFSGLDHGAAWNYDKRQNRRGDPKQVASTLRSFFTE